MTFLFQAAGVRAFWLKLIWSSALVSVWTWAIGSGESMAQSSAPKVARAQKLENYVLVVEPRAMRSEHSRELGGARRTVFTPAREMGGSEVYAPYGKEEFEKLGISWESFVERARRAADRRLATLQPELIKDKDGRVIYAVYRGEEPIYASLMVAPSLARVFAKVFGEEVWVAAPDRHALYVFPAKMESVFEFAADLEVRFESTGFAASEEVFSVNQSGELKAVANFTGR